jgi:signal transduction histidine kinase
MGATRRVLRQETSTASSTQTRQADQFTNLLAIFTWLGVGAVGWLHLPPARQVGELLLLLAFGTLLAVLLWFTPRPRVIHVLLTVQALLVALLILSSPVDWQLFAILFFVLSSVSIGILPQRQGYLWIGVFTLVTALTFLRQAGWPEGVLAMLPFAGGYVFFGAFTYAWAAADAARQESQHLLAELSEAHRQLQAYADRVEALTIAEERSRLARELHDSLGHELTALDIQVELLTRLPASMESERRQTLEQVQRLVKQTLTDVRRAVKALPPAVVEHFSLPEAVGALIADFAAATGLPVTWAVEGEPLPLAMTAVLPLYRTAQEGLTNIRRHAPSTPGVRVRLTYTPHAVSMCVENLPAPAPSAQMVSSGYGLTGLRARAEALGGSLEAGATEAGGFQLAMHLPL